MPAVISKATIPANEKVSSEIDLSGLVLAAAAASAPVKVRIYGQMEAGADFLPLGVQPGPPESLLDLTEGIVVLSVAYVQGVTAIRFEAESPVSKDVTITCNLRWFPND